MAKTTLASLLAAAALLLVAGAAPAAADGLPSGGPGSLPMRDGGVGHWFQRTCATPQPSAAGCNAQVVTDASGDPLASGSPPASAYGPAQFHAAYDLPTTVSPAQTVAIVDAYDDPDITSDLATYDAAFGLPAMSNGAPGCSATTACFEKVNESGGTSLPASDKTGGWELEISLDVETIHAICQNCNIILVEASSDSLSDLGTAENEAVKLGANVVTNSWGASEYASETQDSNTYFDHPGVAITAAAGDSGYGVEVPAASPDVTAVGGTTLTLGAGGARLSETAWSGTGSGCSRYEPKPAWQTDSGCADRTVNDVAADADPNTGAAVYDSVRYSGASGWFQVGGTSLSAQLIGGVYALTGTASGVEGGSTPYAHASELYDVTSGSDGSCSPAYLCTAGPGYDGPTGLGTPNGLGAFTASPASGFAFATAPTSQTVVAGAGTTTAVTLTPSGGFAAAATLSVAGLPGGVSATFDPTSVSASNPGSALSLTTSAQTAPGSYPLTVSANGGGASASTTFTLVVQPAPGFTLALTPSSGTVSAGAGTSATVTLTPSGGFAATASLAVAGLPSGVSAAFNPTSVSASTPSSTLSLTTTAATAPGSYRLTVSASGGGASASSTFTLVVQAVAPPSFTLSATPPSQTVASSGSVSYTVTVSGTNGFSSPVALAVAGLPPGVGATFSPNPAAQSARLTLTATRARAGTAQIVISGTSGSLTRTTSVTLVVGGGPPR